MTLREALGSLDGQGLAILAYASSLGPDTGFSARDLLNIFPFSRHLFSPDARDLESILADVSQRGYLTKLDENLQTYCLAKGINHKDVWAVVYDCLLSTEKSFVRDRMYEIIRDIHLYDFLELQRSAADKDFRDPFLNSFSTDTRLGPDSWWHRVCQLAKTYSDAEQSGSILGLLLEFAHTAGLSLAHEKEWVESPQRIYSLWRERAMLTIRAHVRDITPWKDDLVIQLILLHWSGMSLERRDQIRRDTIRSLIEDATIAHVILPIGTPTERDEEIIKSTQIVVFTPEDSKDIFISRKPSERFRKLLRERIDIELLSPYQIDGFAPPTMFYGRDHEVRLVAAHPEANYALYGGRQSGKTSFLKHLETIYEGKVPVIFMDCQNLYNEEDFWLFVSSNLGMESVRSRTDFVAAKKSIVPGTLLLVDEVDHILELLDPHQILATFRHLNEQHGIRCILAGGPQLYEQFRDLRSPMYNFAIPLALGPLAEKEALALAKDPMDSLAVVFEHGDGTVKQLTNLCGFYPNLVQLMCHELVKLVKTKETRTIKSEMLMEVFEGESFGGYIVDQFLHNFSPLQKLLVYSALMVQEMPLSTIVERVQRYVDLRMDEIEKLLGQLVFLFVLKRDPPYGLYKWTYDGFPKILKKRLKDIDFRISQIVKETKLKDVPK